MYAIERSNQLELFGRRNIVQTENRASDCADDDEHSSHNHTHEYSEHEHNHSHSHAHSTVVLSESGKLGTRFKIGLGLTLAFVFVEFWAGFVANSLALMSDAGHNLSDALALGFSLIAVLLARRAPNSNKTYGYHRAGILAASLNSLTLVLIAGFIFFEAVQRLFNPAEVQSWTVVAVATIALLVNLAVAWLLHDWSDGDLNARSAFLHVITDAAASAGVIVAATAQALTGWAWFDPLISIMIGLLILWSSWGIIKESTNVLLEGIPAGLNMDALHADLRQLEDVTEVHDLHVWTIGSNIPALSCHLQMQSTSTLAQVTQTIHTAKELLEHKYRISHSTIEIESGRCETPCRM